MRVEFCPICASILEIQQIMIHGKLEDFWICPEGDWEDPVDPNSLLAPEEE